MIVGRTMVVLAAALFTLATAARVVGVRYVGTPSVPMGFYLAVDVALELVRVGRYACLDAMSPWAPHVLRDGVRRGVLPSEWRHQSLMKRIGAVAGHRVDYVGDHVTVDGVALAHSTHVPVDSLGRALPKPPYPIVIAPGSVWLTSEHPRGFDSRYFGPVRLEALSCVGDPLWTW